MQPGKEAEVDAKTVDEVENVDTDYVDEVDVVDTAYKADEEALDEEMAGRCREGDEGGCGDKHRDSRGDRH